MLTTRLVTRLVSLSVLVALLLVALLSASPACAEVFPPTDTFAGMLINFSVSGATLGTPADKYGFTTSRRYSGGVLQGPELRVFGTVSQGSGWGASVVVRVKAGSQVQETKLYLTTAGPNPVSKSFDLKVPVAAGTIWGGFCIEMEGNYNAGKRNLNVACDYAPPADGGTTATAPAPPPAAILDMSTCRLEYVRGTVQIVPTDGRDRYLGGTAKAPLRAGDRVKTGPNSRAVLVFPDGTRFKLKSDTTLQLQNDAVHLEVGGTTFDLQKQGTEFQVITPSSVCGTSEAIWHMGCTPRSGGGGTIVAVRRGRTWVTDRAGNNKVFISAGQYSQVKDGQPPSAPQALSAQMAETLFGEDEAPGTEPAPAESTANLSGDVTDLTGQLTPAQLASLRHAQNLLTLQHNLGLAVVMTGPLSATEAGAQAGRYRDQLVAAGKLPSVSGLLLYSNTGARGYSRSLEFDKRVPLTMVRQGWEDSAQVQVLSDRVAAQLRRIGELLGN